MDPKESFNLAVHLFETVFAPKLRQWGISVTPMDDYGGRKEWTIESHKGATIILITPHVSGIGIYREGPGGRIMRTWEYSKEKAVKAIRRKLIKVTAGAIVSICRSTAPPEFTRLYIDYRFTEEKIDWWLRDTRTTLPSEIALTFVIEPTRLRWKWIVEIERRNKFTVQGDDNPIEAHHRILKTGISLATL
ncbi:MAG: hypothetical protein RQ862_01525 [Candidatus Caldarchaeales archaeon]|nr:hypothetical protein [Candidatus Caldarchaeales archaeon]